MGTTLSSVRIVNFAIGVVVGGAATGVEGAGGGARVCRLDKVNSCYVGTCTCAYTQTHTRTQYQPLIISKYLITSSFSMRPSFPVPVTLLISTC